MTGAVETATLLAIGPCGLLTLVQLASLALAARRLAAPDRTSPPSVGAPVSIVRPVRGLEPFSEETLRSGFELDHPAYELIFCVSDADDAVVPLVARLMAEHPGVPARLIVGDERVSANPKLNNCVRGWEAAHHDWVVLSDSNVLMPPDYLQRLQAAWRPDTGLVCSTPIGAQPMGFWAEVECAFLNTLQARWQYAGEALGLGFAQGKSMLWHRPFLDARGGLRALAAEIAEDAAATKLVRAAGRRVHLVGTPFPQPLGRRTARDVWDRQARWARLRRVTFPLFFAPEIGSGALLPFTVAVACTGTVGALGGVIALAALWYGAEGLLARRAGWHLSPRLVLAFLARDALIPALWVGAWADGTVTWRGNTMDIRAKATDPLPPGASTA